MRKLLLLAGCVAGVLTARAEEPKPGTMILKPNAPPTVVPSTPGPVTPDKPGTIVIRPQAPGTQPRSIETPKTPLAKGADNAKPTGPLPNPVPVADPKPVQDPSTTPKTDTKPAAKEETGKILSETYDIAFVKGMKVGYFHVVVREQIKDGKTILYTNKYQEITVGRFGQNVTTKAEDATLESPDGTVLVVRMIQEISTGQRLAITGQVDGQLLRVKGEGLAARAESVPWPEGVLGYAREVSIYKDKKPKPGDTFDYSIWEGRVNRVMKITAKCLSKDMITLVEGQPAKAMLKMEVQMEPIGKFQIPAATIWVDAETFEPMRTDQDLPSLGGRLTLIRSTKEVALRPVGKVPDLFDVQSIRLDKEIPNVHDQAAITFKIDLKSDPEPLSCFSRDSRQVTQLLADKKSVEVKTFHNSKTEVEAAKPLDEKETAIYLGSSFFIDWENDLTKKQAIDVMAALPKTATALEKVKAVELWVNKNIKSIEFSQAMASTSAVSKHLAGDCTEFSMLAVGLCRANGIPSRTALGLVYAPGTGGKPFLAYHMWFEAHIDGRWVPFDATLARGGIGAGHLKITDAHWDKENSFAPLLPVLRVLIAQPKVDVVEVVGMK